MKFCDGCSEKERCSEEKMEACAAVARALDWLEEEKENLKDVDEALTAIALVTSANTARTYPGLGRDLIANTSYTKLALSIGYYLGKFGLTSIEELGRKYPHLFKDEEEV